MKKRLLKILAVCMAVCTLFSTTAYADKWNFTDEEINKTLKTTRTVSEYNSSFVSVTGFAKGGVNDRTEYIGTEYYREVKNGNEFVKALQDAENGKVKVIEVVADIDLGYNVLDESIRTAGCVSEYEAPNSSFGATTGDFTNPTIKQSGVSKVHITKTNGLTVFSKEGHTISHAEFKLQYGANDIIFRNLTFDDMWQWDEAGNHKEVGWAFFKVNGAKNVWLDHCTFTIAADALIDLENAASGVTYSWCEFSLDASAPEKYTNVYKTVVYMEELYKAGIADSSGRYARLRNAGVSMEDIMKHERFHSKGFGVGNEKQFKDIGEGDMPEDSAQRCRLTFAYTKITNLGQRLPRLSVGRVHMFNMYVDNSSHAAIIANDRYLRDIGGLRQNQCIDVHTSGSCAADTCVFVGTDKAVVGREYQGFETSGTGLSSDSVLSKAWRDAKNRALAINSKIVKTNGETYVGSSWDNNGENPLIESSYWDINQLSQDINGTAKSTIGNWVWQSDITNVDNVHRNDISKPIFVFEDNYDAELGYDYQVVELDDVESVLDTYAGSNAIVLDEEGWLRTEYSADEVIPAVDKSVEVKATGVTIRQEDTFVNVGDFYQLDADVAPGNVSNRNVTWTSSDPSVMQILDSGLVKVLKPGTVTFTATTADGTGLTDTVTLTGKTAVEEVEFSKSSAKIKIGEQYQVEVTITPADAYNKKLNWHSSNESVATVDENGVITGISAGKASISCSSEDNPLANDKITITVNDEVYVSPTPSPTPSVDTVMMGDVNADGYVDASDALLVLKHSAKLQILDEEQQVRANVVAGDAIDAGDALEILKYAAGLIDSFNK